MNSWLHRFSSFNSVDLTQFYSLQFSTQPIGWVNPKNSYILERFPQLFQQNVSMRSVFFHDTFIKANLAQRNAMIKTFSETLLNNKLIDNWRDELYGIYSNESIEDTLLFTIERGVIPLLGLKAYGTHINGYTYIKGKLHLWLAKRSATKKIDPLKLDQMAAGGLSFGESPTNNAIRECEEEASIPSILSQTMLPQGKIEYLIQESGCVRNDTLFCYDLELPPSFTPQINDNEVDSFQCINADEVAAQLADPEDQNFKQNSALVILHFLLRHQIISPEHREYQTLQKRLGL